MDLDEMHSDIYDAMAEAVESTRIIIICGSMKYQQSANCNLEIKYAAQKRKKMILIKMEKWVSRFEIMNVVFYPELAWTNACPKSYRQSCLFMHIPKVSFDLFDRLCKLCR